MIKDIHHTSISTTNLKRLLGFYRDLLGMEVIAEGPFGSEEMDSITGLDGARGKGTMLRAGKSLLEIFEYENPQPTEKNTLRRACDPGFTHICFEVTHLQDQYERLKSAGITFHCAPLKFGNSKATYARDPDGNIVELLEI